MAFLDKDGLEHLWSKITAKLSGKADTGHGHSNATTSAAGFMSATDKSKLDGIATGAQKNTITGVKGNSESTYRTGNVNITAANIGLGNVSNTSDANKPVSTAQQAAIDSAEASALADAKSYADELNTAMDSRMDAAESKLSGIASGAEVNQNAFANVVVGSTTIAADAKSDSLTIAAGTGISVTGDATNDKVTITNSGVRSIGTGSSNGTISVNTNGTSANVSVKGLGSAAYTASTAYDAAGTAASKADAALASAKEYADGIKDDLLNGAGTAYDTLKELGDLIDTNADAIDALETVASSKADASALTSHTNNKSNPHGVTLAQLGVTATAAEVNIMDGVTATAAEINKLDGLTATTAELNYVDGVTSNIQSQLDALDSGKADTHSHPYAGSSTQGGSATSAVKLDSSAGSATQPIWFENGKPKATTYALNKTVPSDAKFTDTTYSAATTSANGLMASADKTKLNATNVAYGTCDTAAATAAKVITISGNSNWALTTGSIICVKFDTTNTAENPTFNVNSTGAKSVWYGTAVLTTSSLGYAGTANRPCFYMYDGTQYVFLGWSYDANTTYTNVKLGHGYATCSTAAATTAKVGTLSSYTLVTGGIVAVKFTYDVPAGATLNINSKGAKAIYHKGAAITAGVIKAGDTATFIYSTRYHLISIDRDTYTKAEVDSALAGKQAAGNYAGSSSSGGSATSAVKLDTSTAGSATQPVYFTGGKPSACTYTLGKSVPSDAKFTDTTYTSLKNPYSLTIQGNGTTLTNGTYDGSAAKTVNITASSIGAAASSHSHDTYMTKANPTGTGALSLNRKASTSVGEYSTAEGYNNTATGRAAHSEGEGTTATAQATHAEGYGTTASAYYGHAEGYNTTASARASHAEGNNTVASGQQSHAEGFQTIAASTSQHVQGKYNIEDANDVYAHIVGNGTADARSNAHTLDWNGNAWYANNLTVGDTIYGKNKTSTADGKDGYVLTGNGMLVLQGSSPSINFYGSNATANNGAMTCGASGNMYISAGNNMNIQGKSGGVVLSGYTFYPNTQDKFSLGTSTYKWTSVYATNGSIQTSDRNEKENIVEIDDKYEKLFDKLQPVTYRLKGNDHERTHVGFISQDVKKSMDEVGLSDLDFAAYCMDIKTEYDEETGSFVEVLDENGEPVKMYSLRYGEFIALNTHMIQKTNAKIDEQQAEIDMLKAEIELLKSKL